MLPHRGGMLHLNRRITAEQKALLAAMPPLEPSAAAVQAATWANLSAKLGIARPY